MTGLEFSLLFEGEDDEPSTFSPSIDAECDLPQPFTSMCL